MHNIIMSLSPLGKKLKVTKTFRSTEAYLLFLKIRPQFHRRFVWFAMFGLFWSMVDFRPVGNIQGIKYTNMRQYLSTKMANLELWWILGTLC
jgi:hypothetical protein